jgi:hypothetical protein
MELRELSHMHEQHHKTQGRRVHRMRTIPECTESELSADKTPEPRQIYGDENAQMIWHRVRDWPAQKWPAQQEVRGNFTLKNSPDSRRAVRAVCTIQHGVLRFSIVNSRDEQPSIWVEVPVEHLAVGLQRARCTMLTIAKLHKDVRCDDIYCFADDHATRNKWTGIFRRMGVPIFDEREERHDDAVFPLGPSA